VVFRPKWRHEFLQIERFGCRFLIAKYKEVTSVFPWYTNHT
jgi:hypothetical protein